MSDFGAVYDYALALEAEVPEAALAKVKHLRPGMLPETKAMREAREKEEKEAKAKTEREAAAAAKENDHPKPPPAPHSAPTRPAA